MKEIELRKKILASFQKHCKKCNAPCCLGKDFAVFNWELKKLPFGGKDLVIGKYKNHEKKLAKYALIRNRCVYLGDTGCKLKLGIRPIDCLSYPVYPIIKKRKNKNKVIVEMIGMMVHNECLFYKEISKDRELMLMMKIFWDEKIKHLSESEISDWFGDMRNYWSEKNVIKFLF
jgi:hypothetical protein